MMLLSSALTWERENPLGRVLLDLRPAEVSAGETSRSRGSLDLKKKTVGADHLDDAAVIV